MIWVIALLVASSLNHTPYKSGMQYYGKCKDGRNIHILGFISYEYYLMYQNNGVFLLLTTNR